MAGDNIKPSEGSVMDRINQIAESMAALKENIEHVVEKVDKIDARTATHHDDAIRHDMRIQSIHTRQDEMSKTLADHEGRIKTVENLVQQGTGAAKMWAFLTGIVGAIIGVVGTLVALFKGG